MIDSRDNFSEPAHIADSDQDCLFEMADVRGRSVVTDKIDFSFYYSTQEQASFHAIRAKVVWNPVELGKLNNSDSGYFALHGEYKYSGPRVSAKQERQARDFLKKYKVLFAAVWEGILDHFYFDAYLRGFIDFDKLVDNFELESDKNIILQKNFSARKYDRSVYQKFPEGNRDLLILEDIVRQYDLYNMND